MTRVRVPAAVAETAAAVDTGGGTTTAQHAAAAVVLRAMEAGGSAAGAGVPALSDVSTAAGPEAGAGAPVSADNKAAALSTAQTGAEERAVAEAAALAGVGPMLSKQQLQKCHLKQPKLQKMRSQKDQMLQQQQQLTMGAIGQRRTQAQTSTCCSGWPTARQSRAVAASARMRICLDPTCQLRKTLSSRKLQ